MDRNLGLQTKNAQAFSAFNLITACILLLLTVLFAFREIYSPDIGFHLRAGEWILEHAKFPDKDTFTYTVSQNNYIDMYWLYQIAVAAVNKISGEFGLVLSNGLLIATSFAVALFRLQRKQSIETTPHWSLVFFIAIWAAALLFEPRPHAFSWLYLNVVLLILDDHYERGSGRLFLLPIIMLLWTNTHTLFLLGWVVIWAYVIGIAWRDRKFWTPLTLYAILSVAVSFINPYFLQGVGLPFYQYQFLQNASVFKGFIAEYVSPLDLDTYMVNGRFVFLQPLSGFHLFLLLSIVAFVRRLTRVQLHEVIIFGLFLYISTTGVKNVGYFIFTVLPMTVIGLSRNARAVPALIPEAESHNLFRKFGEWWNSKSARLVLNGVAILASILFIISIVTNAYYVNYRSSYRFGYRYSTYYLPVKAASFLNENNLRGRILNHFNFGGFLIHAIPQKVFIDGRNEVMGEQFFSEYYTHWGLINKRSLLEKYQPDIVIFPFQDDFLWVHYFKRDSTWRPVYVDELAVIYLRKGYGDSVPPLEPASLTRDSRPIHGAEIDNILRREYPNEIPLISLHEEYFPQQEIGLSTFCYYDDRFDAAIQIGLNGLLRSTVPCPEMYYNLGNYFWEKKDFEHSAYCYERLLKTNADGLAGARLAQIRSGSAQHPTMQ